MRLEQYALTLLLALVFTSSGFAFGRLNHIDRMKPEIQCTFNATMPKIGEFKNE